MHKTGHGTGRRQASKDGARQQPVVVDAGGYRLTTAEILYRLPDHPSLLQSFVWQSMDLSPRFPVLHRFLRFWQHEIEGSIHSVRVGSAFLFGPQVRHASQLLTLN